MTRIQVIVASKGIGRYKIFADPDRWRSGLMSRCAVAGFIVRPFEDQTYIRNTPLGRY